MRVRHSPPRAPVQEAEIAAPYDNAGASPSPAAWDRAYERGRGMTVEDVLAEVRREDAGQVESVVTAGVPTVRHGVRRGHQPGTAAR